MVCTARPLPLDHSMTDAQGPQGQTNLTVVLVAHSGAPGRPRTPDSKQAHRHQGKTSALRATPESSTPFQDPGGSASAQRTRSGSAGCARCGVVVGSAQVLLSGGSSWPIRIANGR